MIRFGAVATVFFMATVPVRGSTITTQFLGGPEPISVHGTGTIAGVFNAAARIWEAAILDAHDLHLGFGWKPQVDAASHILVAQGGDPNRETHGEVWFNPDITWFLDSTPFEWESEYGLETKNQKDLGGGPITVGHYMSAPIGPAAGVLDLLMIALHEMGHALGLSMMNTSFSALAWGGDIVVTDPRPYAGTVIPVVRGGHTDPLLPYGGVMAGGNYDERRYLSEMDILAVAQVSGFTNINLSPNDSAVTAVPELGTLVLSGLALLIFVRLKTKS